MKTAICGIALATPVILAAGTGGVLDEMSDVIDLSRVGAVTTKSITPEPRAGNAAPRITFARAALLNAIGLANPGIDRFVRDFAPRASALPCPVVASAAGFSIDDYARVAGAFDDCQGLAAIELNVSCPNVHGGTEFGADPDALGELVRTVRSIVVNKKLIVKLSPIVVPAPHSPADLARVAIDAGADALTLCNTIPAMGIDVETRKPVLANTTGGLSGPAIHPAIVKIVYEVYRDCARAAGVPIIAAGGVMRWQDAAEFILSGASAVQIGAGLFADPRLPITIAKGLARWAKRQGASEIGELVGGVRV